MNYLGLTLDPFQEKAVTAVDNGFSLIVAAPTGCGKTVIAEYAADVCLGLGRKAIYTAPIKALSNQKFRDFRARLGEDAVGIHTGDVSMNPQAPLLIMTTEIFRNLILEGSSRLDNVHYVIFDEIHYLDDAERGTVWEECIILAPPQIRFLCLSATVPNIEQLARWMEQVRGCRFEIIEENHRPVPLRHFLYSPRHGRITLRGIRKLYKKQLSERKRFLMHRPSSKRLVDDVLNLGRFPVLYFCFNRRACERNAELHSRRDLLSREEHERITRLVDTLVRHYNLSHYDKLDVMRDMWESGCAYHHAGILPAAKEIVERLFTTGLIKLLFCTDTFALGINMPASTVIIDELEKFNGVEFRYLMTRTYHQIAGRAGRRGMDDVGYVYAQVVPEATDPREVERILYGKNEDIRSRFLASYSTILNLYSTYGEGAFDMFKKSFKNYRNGHFELTGSYLKEEQQIRNRIAFLQAAGFLDGTSLTAKGKLAAAVSGYEIQTAELYYSNSFDTPTPAELCVILSGLIAEESRRSARARKNSPSNARLRFDAEKIIHRLRRTEQKFNIANPVPEMELYLAAPVFAWANGCTLNDLLGFGASEGDLVRLMRMIIQLLRTLREIVPDPVVAERMHEAIALINRDVVDAQAQLQVE